ncbi:MAG TPA: sugar phosphate nucleotidyltransferase [Leptospiraceae bacterium]|nr:sugar phosphate nucleotidyltransferase [Leptospiraceae bacterium]HRG76123.1 sugar phosphate nucleotidyltransferase [Leptospiraceae bacterium]
MKCFILAAGFGKRMGDLTANLPKPLLPYQGKTLLDHTIDFAAELGITEFIVNTHYQAEKIQEHLKKYTEFEFHISYEPEILGTGGGIKQGIKTSIREDEIFLTLNPDVQLTARPEDLRTTIQNYTGDCMLFLSHPEIEEEYTTLDLQNGKVYFREGNYFYVGMSLLKASILKEIPENSFYDLALIFKALSKENRLDGFVLPGEAIDFGDKDKYLKLTAVQ